MILSSDRLILFFSLLPLALLGMQAQQPPSLDAIIQEHITTLPNLDKEHEPLLILFSATAGMGKTTVAKKIEDALGAVRITLDEVRILMKKYGVYPLTGTEQDRITCIMNYLDKLLLALEKKSKNHLVILDDTVDRMHQKIATIAANHKCPTFLIQVKASKETAIRRIKAREKDPQGYLDNMDRWYKDYLAFDSKCIDYAIDNDTDGKDPAIKPLLDALKTKHTVC